MSYDEFEGLKEIIKILSQRRSEPKMQERPDIVTKALRTGRIVQTGSETSDIVG